MRNLPTFILSFGLLLSFTSVRADIVKLKDGTTIEGKITLQTPDMIKIEVPITDKIKETKTLGMVDVSEVIKTAPDDALFATIQPMVPTPSLVTADQYRSMLTTGPEAFLSSFAGSKHKEKVEEIKKVLEEELDKVERGNIKLEGTWYSPQDKNDFPKLIESKIVLLRMKSQMQGGRYLNLISAMREYENLETNYFGSPAFGEGVALAQQILPALGNQLKGLRRDVDVKNTEWEASKNALSVEDRARVEAARAREEEQFSAAVAVDKKAKINWTRVNPRSASNLDSYLQFAGSEYTRIKNFDPALIKEMGEALVEVDKMIQKGDLDRARIKLSEASAMPVSADGGSKKSSSSSKGKGSSSYPGALMAKLNEKDADRKAIAKAEAEAKKSASLTADLKNSQKSPTGLLDAVEDAAEEKSETEVAKPGVDEFDLLAKAPVKKEEVAKVETSGKKSGSSKSKEPREPREPLPPEKEPFPFTLIGIGLAVLAGAAVVIMKVLGIGGKKDGDD